MTTWTDDQVWAGIDRHLEAVDALIPEPPEWLTDAFAGTTTVRVQRGQTTPSRRWRPQGRFARGLRLAAIAAVVLALLASLFYIVAGIVNRPDGRLVISHGGEIYLLDPDTLATQDLGPGSAPTWLHEPRLIAFRASDGQPWVMSPDGTGRRRVPDGYPSPDGSRYLVTDPAAGDNPPGPFRIVRTDGGPSLDLGISEAESEDHPNWSPDGKRVAIVDWIGGLVDGHALVVVDATGTSTASVSASRRVIHVGGLPWWERWSPDGSTIAFLASQPGSSSQSLWLARPDGSGEKVVVQDAGAPIAWSPDGRALTYTTAAPGSECPGSACRIEAHAIDLQSGVTWLLFSPPVGMRYWADWSPDGRRLEISAYPFNCGQDTVTGAQVMSPALRTWIVNADGTAARELEIGLATCTGDGLSW